MADRLEAHAANIGGNMDVRRALPTARRRLIGAWCFLDHFGPADIVDSRGLRVGPHPHVGLQTVTWLLDGEVLHRDSLGSLQRIEPGALNLMTAGRGISHSEESPDPHSPKVHGVQFWIALPETARRTAPAFDHYPRVPVVKRDGVRVTVLAGELLGEASPARLFSPLVGASVALPAGARTVLPLRPDFEHGAVVVHGEAQVGGERLAPGALLYFEPGTESLPLAGGSSDAIVILVGGEPLREPVVMWWNFVGRRKDELAQASRDWNEAAAYLGDVRGYDGPRLVAPMPPWTAADEVVRYP